MKEQKTLPHEVKQAARENVIAVLERMLEDCKHLCREDDPVLQGQVQVVLGILADLLETKDPHHHFEHLVEYE